MDKTYNPQDLEQKLYATWEQAGYFAPQGEGSPYCIMIPPPNITGTLHMGHGFQYSLMDALIRYHRMDGDQTLWQVGLDHAGISTQMVVERQVEAAGTTRKILGRDNFLKRIWDWKEESGNTITNQFRRMGISVDWSRERFTMDAGLSKAVQEVFIRLFDEGLIYRGQRLVNWDPTFRSAISDLEVVSEEENGFLWHLQYPVTNSQESLIVATTRPETMLGDTAVAVHPEDTRYQHLIGKTITLPLTHRQIPIIADDSVDPTFGTGCVKITPAHDFNDYAMGKRHDLPMINIFTEDAKINQNAPEIYQGLDRFVAREKIIANLTALGLLVKIEPHKLKIPRGERGGAVIEPFLTQQWFMKMKPLAEPAIQAVEKGEIRFVPENWNKTYFQWLNNIEDWCISRQLWWGHRIPAWYDSDHNIYVGHDEAEVRDKYKLKGDVVLQQDKDVLDTWFSSALWPFSTLGWPENTEYLNTFYPTSVLVTGFDIIFFWVARMVMLGLKFTGKVPFREVYITGLIRDHEGHKMSKTKGNVIDPIDLIDGIDLESLVKKRTSNMMQPAMAKDAEIATRKQFPNGIKAHGTDALRFTYCALASTGRDIRFDLGRLEGYRNFCNKLWNATRYVCMNTENQDVGLNNTDLELSAPDRWILSRLQNTIQNTRDHLDHYRFDLAAQALYEFTWNEYCDWYLELSKPVLTNPEISAASKRGTRHTLVCVLENILRLLHPFMPFITEEMWLRIAPMAGKTGPTIMLQAYPKAEPKFVDSKLEQEIEWLKNMILGIRNIRGEMNIAPSLPLPLILNNGNSEDKTRVQAHQTILISLAKLSSITWQNPAEKTPPAATALVGDLELLIPLADLIDKEAETTRLNKEIAKLRSERDKAQTKLANPQFVDHAPPAVVAQEQQRLSEFESALTRMQQQLVKIQGL